MKLNMSQTLKDYGIRLTKVREAVFLLLVKEARPLSHNEIISHSEISKFDRVTIYRTLEVFLEARLIHQVKGTDGGSRFGANFSDSHRKCTGDHIHFLCSVCNEMTCLPEQPLPWVNAPKGFEIQSKQLVVYGVCSVCHKKKSKAKK